MNRLPLETRARIIGLLVAKLVETCSGSGLPITVFMSEPMQVAGL